MTVDVKNPDSVANLTVNVDGCLKENQLNFQLSFPLSMLHNLEKMHDYILIHFVIGHTAAASFSTSTLSTCSELLEEPQSHKIIGMMHIT